MANCSTLSQVLAIDLELRSSPRSSMGAGSSKQSVVTIVSGRRSKVDAATEISEAPAAVEKAEQPVVPPPAPIVKQTDNALIRDLMEYFCFAVKSSSSFRGTVLFIFQVTSA